MQKKGKKKGERKKELAGGIPQIFPLGPAHHVLPCPLCTPRDEEALQTCLAAVQGGRVVFVQRPYSLPGIMAGTVSTDAVTSVEHQTDTENILERGGSRVKFQRVSALRQAEH